MREPEMIFERRIVPRRWRFSDTWPTEGETDVIVPLEVYLAEYAKSENRSVGVSLKSDQDVSVLSDHLESLPVIALSFPTWKDGRAYSQARKLRHLMKYRGVLLAHGDVLRDQLLYMSRVGFDAFYMREDQDLQGSLRAFSLYSAFYQY